MRNLRYLLLLFCCLNFNAMVAQEVDKSCACCTEIHKQFDFWVGDWNVYGPNGELAGTNSISKTYEGCVLLEKWESSSPVRGTSYNYYDKSDNTWNQLWIDTTGFVLNLKGSFKNGSMVLKSELNSSPNGKFYHQISWTLNSDSTVTQLWETFDEQDQKTGELFRGIYKKKLN